MNRTSFQQISKLRTREAAALLAAGFYQGSYYLCGYAVECALKACVAKQVRRHDFPDKDLVTRAHTHNLESLMRLSSHAPEFYMELGTTKSLELNWAVVKDWSESSRYEIGTTEKEARDLFSACTGRKHGILNWIQRRW